MDIAHIPRSFWHSLSFCMVVATVGILYVAYTSSTVSIEIANAKIELSSAISKAKDIKSDLKIENTRLIDANENLKEKLKALETKAAKSSTGISVKDLKAHGISGGKNSLFRKPFGDIDSSRFEELDEKIQSAEKLINK